MAPSREVEIPMVAAASAAPMTYLSYGMSSVKGRRPALTDAVVALPSFTSLSPEMRLDYFAVVDGRYGEAAGRHLRERLALAVAEQIDDELLCEAPRFVAGSDDGVVGWWRTTLRAAFRVADEEAVSRGVVGDGVAAGATALVALFLEKYVVLANSGASRAVVSRGGEVVQLTPEHRANDRPDDETQGAGSSGAAAGSSPSNPGVVTEPEVVAVERTPRDEFLILASDGLWDAVTPAAACAFVRVNLLRRTRMTMPWEAQLDAGRGSPTIVARELAQRAVRKGSQDNVSVVLILFRDFWATRANQRFA
ncbi:hypothetical protein ACP4OV_020754 [Aristida adscensionis]